jgi:hypothetical protein
VQDPKGEEGALEEGGGGVVDSLKYLGVPARRLAGSLSATTPRAEYRAAG